MLAGRSNSFKPPTAGDLFGQYKMMQKHEKMTDTLAHGYSSVSNQRELSNVYQQATGV